MDLNHKHVTVVGLGRSGFAAAKFLSEKGAFVFATDASAKPEVLKNARALEKLGVRTETGVHTPAALEKSVCVITSPGVPKSSLPLREAKRLKIPVISEVELASYFCRGRILAVTGSNGKTTTSHLLHRILEGAGRKSVLCGNVGTSFLEVLPKIDSRTWVVLELSSFQLEDSPTFRPDIAVVLNVSPNHLDRHGTFVRYLTAKENIFRRQKKSDRLILNYDDPSVRAMARKARARVIFFSHKPLKRGLFEEGPYLILRERADTRLLDTTGFRLQGRHNRENIMAAVAAAQALGLPMKRVQKTLKRFKTLEHRVEPLGSVRGVYFVNDSKSTTVDSTAAAIRTVRTPLVLVAGGRDKGVDFRRIEPLLLERVKAAVLYGEARVKMAAAWRAFRKYRLEEKFDRAVESALAACSSGDTLLLSPMCASFDQFRSFEERGETFKRFFKKLKNAPRAAGHN